MTQPTPSSSVPRVDDRGLIPRTVIRPEFEVTPRQLSEALQANSGEKMLLVDVRLASEIQVGTIAGAIHVPLHEIEQRVDEIVDAATDRTVVTICHHGVRSLKASLFLRQAGISNAMSLAGGMDAWSIAIDRTIPRYERSGEVCRVLR